MQINRSKNIAQYIIEMESHTPGSQLTLLVKLLNLVYLNKYEKVIMSTNSSTETQNTHNPYKLISTPTSITIEYGNIHQALNINTPNQNVKNLITSEIDLFNKYMSASLQKPNATPFFTYLFILELTVNKKSFTQIINIVKEKKVKNIPQNKIKEYLLNEFLDATSVVKKEPILESFRQKIIPA